MKEIFSGFSNLVDSKEATFSKIKQGRNSQVYKIEVSDGRNYCGKVYPAPSYGRIDRLYAERVAIAFLRDKGFTCVPNLVGFNESCSIAVFDWIDGKICTQYKVTDRLIYEAVEFIEQINSFRKTSDAIRLPHASEACFSLNDLLANLNQRLKDLLQLEQENDQYLLMKNFVKSSLWSHFCKYSDFALKGYANLNISPDSQLSFSDRILSPSDYGFHNSLLSGDKIYWLDFEYFGWDDPAKTLIDFILHPGMKLSEHHKRLYAGLILRSSLFSDESIYRSRFLFFLYGIKWCLIMLNEFLGDGIQRRMHAGLAESLQKQSCRQQLKKSQSLLKILAQYDKKVPYF